VFGFYDATDQALDSFTPPFNKKFLSFITKQRIEAHQAPVYSFTKYRKTCDPGGLFYTQYLRDLLEGSVACGRQRWTPSGKSDSYADSNLQIELASKRVDHDASSLGDFHDLLE